MKNVFKKKSVKIWSIVSVLTIALFTTATVLSTTTYHLILNTVLGGKTPIMSDEVTTIYTSDYKSKAESKAAGDALNQTITEEGFTLLLNENNALPLKSSERKVSVFGKNSVNLVLGGTGSGGMDGTTAKTLYDGLDAAGIEYNPELKKFYESGNSGSGRSDSPDTGTGSNTAPTLNIGETPVSNYDNNLRNSFQEYNDAAIVVISRLGGESWDLPRSQNVNAGGIEGNHYLQLDQNEYDMLDMVTANFKKVIVVLNTLTSFQCDFIEQYNNIKDDPRIDAVVWIGGPGYSGAESIGKLLTGEANFSGRTVDIYSRDFTKDPTYQNFGDNSQVNDGVASNYFMDGSARGSDYYVSYEEGIYYGYRYYETRGYEESKEDHNIDWYGENVIFPFGYGLSYTTFDQNISKFEGSLSSENAKLTISVDVTNIGDVAGKDVVELYVTLPYTQGGIEKSHVQLVDFAKTDLLEKDDHQTIIFEVNPYDLASYDYNDANGNGFKGYELEAGDYTFYVAKNSHVDDANNVYAKESINLAESIKFENDTTTNNPVTNLYTYGENNDGVESDGSINFNDLQYRLQDVTVTNSQGEEEVRKGMSRSNFADTFPTADTKLERVYLEGEKEAIADKTTNNDNLADATMPTTNAAGDITLFDLIGKDYNDEDWNKLLDRLTGEEMLSLVNNGAFQTVAIEKIKKNLTNDSDGPIGFVNFMPGLSSHYKDTTTFACEIVIASTWNKSLAYEMGKIVGDNGVWGDVNGNNLPYTGWYAPAVNIHRSPFAGRNFEYYSEDPILSGKMAVNVINGAAQKGVYTDLKHFALNDQETSRGGVATYCTEQALREIYLKPFEIAVKGYDNVSHNQSAIDDGVEQYAGSKGVMSSFNRIGTRWTGGDYRLLTKILREEWGFEGLVICDYKTDNSVMNSRQMLYAGNDLILASLNDLLWNDCDFTSAEDMTILRNAAHNILYVVANSNSMNVDVIGYKQEWWVTTLIVVDVAVLVALGVYGAIVIVKAKKKEEEK